MQRSIATPFDARRSPTVPALGPGGPVEALLQGMSPTLIGLIFVMAALAIYLFSDPSRNGFYNHFVWQADAYIHGRFGIAYPVETGQFRNDYFQDVMPLPSFPGQKTYALLPFPPLPAVVLLPFVALFGLATDAQLVGVALGAINVGLAWRMTTRLTERRAVSALATIFFGFGTVAWYASMLSSTWFLAHVVAITFTLLAITLALDGEHRERAMGRLRALRREQVAGSGNPIVAALDGRSMFLSWYRRLRPHFEPLQFMAGFVFGVAALARLTVVFAAPFFVFVGPGGSIWKRGLSAALGAVIPVALLLTYNLLSSGHLFNPAYEYLYKTEYLGYMPAGLEVNRSYGIEDIRHIPINLLIMLGWPPKLDPSCSMLALLSKDCAPIQPDPIGMSVLLTSPAYLLALPYAITHWRKRVVVGASLAVVAVAFVNLMHFSQGWVQFGYRFSNDFAPFALVIVTLGIAWLWERRLAFVAVAFVGVSVLVNAWGVYWGVTLGW